MRGFDFSEDVTDKPREEIGGERADFLEVRIPRGEEEFSPFGGAEFDELAEEPSAGIGGGG